mmetsp:Transcript_537/g.1104  ORF Transcript_537/g.1104 Transcript_537/m.1104 type:complete len:83 (-) Transcript_537:35-283(-)
MVSEESLSKIKTEKIHDVSIGCRQAIRFIVATIFYKNNTKMSIRQSFWTALKICTQDELCMVSTNNFPSEFVCLDVLGESLQ